ncbi:MAG: hypothetical protein PHQ23_05475 [Candidatus Wallbacteria bacterium]|nr:hypothetical protein [Candidatus Wallbacteria bacterium]
MKLFCALLLTVVFICSVSATTDNALSLYKKSVSLFMSGQIKTAVDLYAKALETDSSLFAYSDNGMAPFLFEKLEKDGALFKIADYYFHFGNLKEARVACENVIARLSADSAEVLKAKEMVAMLNSIDDSELAAALANTAPWQDETQPDQNNPSGEPVESEGESQRI